MVWVGFKYFLSGDYSLYSVNDQAVKSLVTIAYFVIHQNWRLKKMERILIPNRNIAVISHFRVGCIRAYVDIQLPREIDEAKISQAILAIAKGMHQQHKSIILAAPENFGIKDVKDGQWRYLRIKFKLWPGQMKIIEETFKEMVVQALKKSYTDYAAWMITVTYKVE